MNIYFRASIIPYCISENQLTFLFGIDKDHNEITDLGGRSEIGETVEQCALREFNEESCFIFEDYVHIEKLYNSYKLEDSKNTVFFVKLQKEWLSKDINTIFKKQQQNYKARKYNEISNLVWINQRLLKGFFIYNSVVWSYITNYLNSTTYDKLIYDIYEKNNLNSKKNKYIMKRYEGSFIWLKPYKGVKDGCISIVKNNNEVDIDILGTTNKLAYSKSLEINFNDNSSNKQIKCIINMNDKMGKIYVYNGCNSKIKILQNEGYIKLTEVKKNI